MKLIINISSHVIKENIEVCYMETTLFAVHVCSSFMKY